MLIQSHEGIIHLLPAVPDQWGIGSLDDVCAGKGFELSMKWQNKSITEMEVLSKAGKLCRIYAGGKYKVSKAGKK